MCKNQYKIKREGKHSTNLHEKYTAFYVKNWLPAPKNNLKSEKSCSSYDIVPKTRNDVVSSIWW